MKRIAFAIGIGVLAGASFNAAPSQDALAQFREALGGDAALNAVRTIRVRGKIKVKPYDDHFDIAVAFPDRFVKTMRTMRRGDFNWSTEWGYIPGQWQPRQEPMLVGGTEETYTHVSGFNGDVLLPLGRNVYRSPEDIARALDGTRARMAEVLLPLLAGTSSSYRVDASSEGNAIVFRAENHRSWRLEFDPITHLPATMTWTYPLWPGARAGARPVNVRTEFSDFRVVSGLRWPHRLVTQADARPVEDAVVQRYEVNAKLSDKMFRK